MTKAAKIETYRKIRFYGSQGATAGLIIPESQYQDSTTGDLSRLYPNSEFRKMSVFQVSPAYPTWEDAFAHKFNCPEFDYAG